MSLKKFRRNSLLDKHEEMRERIENTDSERAKIIKKSSKKE